MVVAPGPARSQLQEPQRFAFFSFFSSQFHHLFHLFVSVCHQQSMTRPFTQIHQVSLDQPRFLDYVVVVCRLSELQSQFCQRIIPIFWNFFSAESSSWSPPARQSASEEFLWHLIGWFRLPYGFFYYAFLETYFSPGLWFRCYLMLFVPTLEHSIFVKMRSYVSIQKPWQRPWLQIVAC